MASVDEKLVEKLIRENKELKQKLKREVELYESSNMDMIRVNVEMEKATQELTGLNKKLDNYFDDTINLLKKIIEIRSPGYKKHAIRVMKGCEFLSAKLNLHEEEKHNILVAARIHEIGKVGIRRSIFNKKDKDLTEDDICIIHRHPSIAKELFEGLKEFEEISDIIVNIRENYDGSGFTEQKNGDAIPIGSRILALVETYDTFYIKKKMGESAEDVYRKILEMSDTSFDPKLVEIYEEFVIQNYTEKSIAETQFLDLEMLEPGMKLARSMRTISNIMLLSKETVLTDELIDKIKTYAQRELVESVEVYKKR